MLPYSLYHRTHVNVKVLILKDQVYHDSKFMGCFRFLYLNLDYENQAVKNDRDHKNILEFHHNVKLSTRCLIRLLFS